MTRYELESDDGQFSVEVLPDEGGFKAVVSGKEYHLKLKRQLEANRIVVELGDKPVSVTLHEADPAHVQMTIDHERFDFRRSSSTMAPPGQRSVAATVQKDAVVAPMPGKVISTLVKKGEKVKSGDPLVILESMKMEVAVRADRDAEVAEVLVSEGAPVKRAQALVRLG